MSLIGDDLVLLNPDVYRGKDDIFIRLLHKNGKSLALLDLHFSKDQEGNSYFYSSVFGFGLKLNDQDAYDKIAKSIVR